MGGLAITKLGIISDTHGYEEPLETVLDRLSLEGVTAIGCLGDIVSGGQAADACVDLLKHNAVQCIAGNHDRDAMVHNHYGAAVTDFLKRLPQKYQLTINNRRYGMFHENPLPDANVGRAPFQSDAGIANDEQADYVFRRMCEQDYHVIFVGHCHRPRAWMHKARTTSQLDVSKPIHIEDDASYIFSPGAVAEPKVLTPHAVANPRKECDAHYGVYDVAAKSIVVRSFPLFRDGAPVFPVKPRNARDYR